MNTKSGSANDHINPRTPRVIVLLLLAALVLPVLTGCESSDRGTAKIDPTGVYTLVSVDGRKVPCEVMHGETPMTIKSGAFTINTDGTCHSLMKFSVAGHEDVSREVKATYSLKASELMMKWERAGTTIGKVEGKRFTMTNEGMVLAYAK